MKGARLVKNIIISILTILIVAIAFELKADLGNAADYRTRVDVRDNETELEISGSTDAGTIYNNAGEVTLAYIWCDQLNYKIEYKSDESTCKTATSEYGTAHDASWTFIKINTSDLDDGDYTIVLEITEPTHTHKRTITITFTIGPKPELELNPTISNAKYPHEPIYDAGVVPEGATVKWYDGSHPNITDPSMLRNTPVGSHHIYLTVTHPDYEDGYVDLEYEVTKADSKITLDADKYKPGDKINAKVFYEDYNDTEHEFEYVEISPTMYTLEYRSESSSTYSSEMPTTAGKYKVRPVLNSDYGSFILTPETEFEIYKNEGKGTIKVADIKYGETPKPVIESDNYDKDKAKVYYKESGANDSTFSATIPKKPGNYVAQVLFPANDSYTEHIDSCKFKIGKADGEGKVAVKDAYVGTKLDITTTSDKNGINNVKYDYKLATAGDSTYSSELPLTPGTYSIRALFLENEYYLSAKSESTFKLTYMPNPGYSIAGVKGKNDFYTSDVIIKAPAGYKISTSYGKGYTDELKYSTASQSKYMYFMDAKTGALSDKVEMPTYKIDSKKPSLNKDYKNKEMVYSDTEELIIDDENLDSVLVNGEAVEIINGKAKFSIMSNGGKEIYEIVAIDKAGNAVTYEVTVAAEWLVSGVIPSETKVKLEAGVGYTLDSGKWTVSNDDTVYMGGMEVYVAEDVELEFAAK